MSANSQSAEKIIPVEQGADLVDDQGVSVGWRVTLHALHLFSDRFEARMTFEGPGSWAGMLMSDRSGVDDTGKVYSSSGGSGTGRASATWSEEEFTCAFFPALEPQANRVKITCHWTHSEKEYPGRGTYKYPLAASSEFVIPMAAA